MAGVEDTYLYQLTGFVADLMRPAYPELMETVQRVARVVKDEEHRYATTFLVAEKVFNDEVKSLGTGVLPGPVAFKLYDTYGLALDEQEEMARERGFSIDRDGFEVEMKQQRERARASWKGAAQAMVAPAYKDLLAKGAHCHEIGSEAGLPALRLPPCAPPLRPILEILPVQMMTLALAALAGREAGYFEQASKITGTE